ncbi:MAG: Lrp/AsnC family transcriptional regulator [Deinococcota bacterium]
MNRDDTLDTKDWQLLKALHANARLSFSELAKSVKLSVPATAERVRKLEDKGVITGYSVQLDLKKLERPLKAVIRFQGTGQQMKRIAERVGEMPEVIQAFRMTGDTCFMAVVAVTSTDVLEMFLDSLHAFGQTHTSIIVSEPVGSLDIDKLSATMDMS